MVDANGPRQHWHLLILLAGASPQVLQDFQENPKAAQAHLKQPVIMEKIQKLVAAGIVRMA